MIRLAETHLKLSKENTMSFQMIALSQVAQPVLRSVLVLPGTNYRTIGVKWWGEGAYERETIDGTQTAAKTLTLVKENDLIINKIWVRNGSTAIASQKVDGCVASGEFPTFELDQTKILPRWLHWITKTKNFWQKCDDLSRGTSGKNRIRPELFLTIEIPLPPLEEQHRIVARIEEVAAKIEEARGLRRGIIEETESLIISQANNLIQASNSPRTELHQWLDSNRDGIQTGPFGAQLSSADFIESGVPVLTIGNIQYAGLKLNDLKYVSTEKSQQLSRFAVKHGDILFARMGTVGRCCIVPLETENWLINYHIIRVALDKAKVDYRYVYWNIRASIDIKQYLEDQIRGATRQGVNSSIVSSLPMHIPSLIKQKQIVDHLDELQSHINLLKQKQAETSAELDALLPSILDKAFKGEL